MSVFFRGQNEENIKTKGQCQVDVFLVCTIKSAFIHLSIEERMKRKSANGRTRLLKGNISDSRRRFFVYTVVSAYAPQKTAQLDPSAGSYRVFCIQRSLKCKYDELQQFLHRRKLTNLFLRFFRQRWRGITSARPMQGWDSRRTHNNRGLGAGRLCLIWMKFFAPLLKDDNGCHTLGYRSIVTKTNHTYEKQD